MSTLVTSASPAHATPCTRTVRELTIAPSVGQAIKDFTVRAVTGCEFSAVNASPGFMVSFGSRYPGFMKLPSNGLSRTLISVSHLQDAAPTQPGTRARAGYP